MLKEFFKKWNFSDMQFVILETFKEITFGTDFNKNKIGAELIERIRIFGNSGDLDLRRNNHKFIWRYIGKNNLPEGIDSENFWEKYPDIKFFVEEKEALLWGKYDINRKLWHDDRVARAKLYYPVNGNPEMVKICYKTFSERGCISFVWFTKIKGGN